MENRSLGMEKISYAVSDSAANFTVFEPTCGHYIQKYEKTKHHGSTIMLRTKYACTYSVRLASYLGGNCYG